MSIPLQSLEQDLRHHFHIPEDPFSISPTYEQEASLRQQKLDYPQPVTIVVGLGPGGVEAVNARGRAGHHVFAFDAGQTPSGKLPLVSPDKGLHALGITEALKALTIPTVHAYLGAFISPSGEGTGISLPELVGRSNASEVLFGTGTRERRTILVDGHDLGEYQGHAYAYELIGQMNEWMTAGKNLADFPLAFDHSGDSVVISGAGLVALEDMGKLILAYQLAIKLREHGVDITEQDNPFAQLKLAAQPLSTLVTMYNDIGEVGKKVRAWLGNDLVLTGQTANQTLLPRLHELGIKPTHILYRKSQQEHVRKDSTVKSKPDGTPDNRLTQDQLNALSRVGGYQMMYSREPGFVSVKDGRINTLTLITRDYDSSDKSYSTKEVLHPALVISALGGESPKIKLAEGQILTPNQPILIGNTTFAVIGNAVEGKGNRNASIASTETVLKSLDATQHLETLPPSHTVRETVAWLDSLGLAPSNIVHTTLSNLPELLLTKWDLAKQK